MNNPLLEPWNTPFSSPPFDKFDPAHYLPAVETAIKYANEEISVITENPAQPDFENTIAALDKAGELLGKISAVLFNLNSADTNKDLQTAAREVSPLLARFSNDITLNEKLFEKIKSVYDTRDLSLLNTEQKILPENKYRNFMLGGAGLKDHSKERFREISVELASLSLQFDENLFNAYML